VWIVDIAPQYSPSATMLSGEPYLLDYLRTIDEVVGGVASVRGRRVSTFEFVRGHVRAWVVE
jgi:hypothetical protein